MSHSYNKLWIHAVLGTKDRYPLIHHPVEAQVYNHIREQLIELGCPVRIINGAADHVHALFLLNPKLPVTDVIKQIKGNTSHWINEQNLIPEKFAWQSGYGAFSVSESQVERVYEYIKNQKGHHRKKSFAEEYEEFIVAHGLSEVING